MDDHSRLAAHTTALRALARAVVADPHEADDAVQDAWVAALSRPPGAGPVPLAWLRTVVRRGAWRRTARDRGRLLGPDDDQVARTEPGPSAVAERLAAAIQRLPEQYRAVLELRYWSDLPPRRVAAELGLDVRVVRNRLHRALEQLRRELARRGDDGRTHLPALALFAQGGSTQTPTHAAAFIALAMSTKLGLLAAAGVLVAIVLSTRDQRPVATPPTASPSAPTAAPPRDSREGETARAIDRTEPAPATRRSVATDEPPPPPPTVEAELDRELMAPLVAHRGALGVHGGTGTILLEVLDSTDLTPIDDFSLTVTDDRSQGRPAFAWTAGRLPRGNAPAGDFIGAVFANGYDAEVVEPIRVVDGETTDLGTVYLNRGSASIEGRVELPGELAGRAATVDLHAAGRRSGACCEIEGATDQTPCPQCGWGINFSRRAVVDGEPFHFSDLSGGPVRLVARDDEDRVLAAVRLVLEAREHRTVTISVATKDIEVELTGEDGAPFDGLWLEDGLLFSAPIQLHAWIDDLVGATAEIAGTPQGLPIDSGKFSDPILQGFRDPTPQAADERADPLRALWPRALNRPPRLDPSPRPVVRIAPGRFRVLDVPAGTSAVQIACGPYITDPVPLEVEVGLVDRARIAVVNRCGYPSLQMVEAQSVSCVSCHASPDRD